MAQPTQQPLRHRSPASKFLGCLRWKPRLEEVVDKGAQVVTQNQQDREQHNGEEDDDQCEFNKALTTTVRWQTGHGEWHSFPTKPLHTVLLLRL